MPHPSMNSKLLGKIIAERQRYIEFFREGINSFKKDKRKDDFAIELPIQTNDATIPEPFNIVRVDFITKDQNGEYSISELRLDKILNFDSIKCFNNNVEIILNPFSWNSCEIQTDKIEIDALKKWVIKWLKVEEEINGEQLSNAIHSCTEPELITDMFTFIIDFGTANEQSFEELLQLVSNMDSTKIEISTVDV